VLIKALAAARETLYQRRRVQTPGAQKAAAGQASAGSTVDGRCDPDEAAPFAPVQQEPIDPPTMDQLQADALALLAETALHHGIDPGTPGERYQVVVHVDAAVLADAEAPGQSVLEDGARVPAGTSQRLACDATRVVMRHDPDGRPLEVGARTRTIPAALRRALQHRDAGCRFPGCSVRFGQGHHIRHWARGGPTTLSNLALLCRRHHRAVHEEGYQVERRPDGELEFRWPNGRVLPDVPPAPLIEGDPVTTIRARNEADGLALTPHTATPGWTGERLDVAYAMDVLHPLALAGAGPAGARPDGWRAGMDAEDSDP
jgi:5-methylcytosine-specific restriction endonuclease McrA